MDRETFAVPRRLTMLIPMLALLLAACSLAPVATAPTSAPVVPSTSTATDAPAPTPAPIATSGAVAPTSASTQSSAMVGDQPTLLTGTFTYTNDIITTYYVENSVALLDMYGFVKRDKLWELPVESQVLGYMKIDEAKKTGTFRLALPEHPEGKLVDVGKTGGQGVQVFALSYMPNAIGGPFSVGDDRSRGWPSYLASTKNDSENQDEVIGGKLVVWSPDSAEQFPTGYGADGKLFSADDPVGPLPAGYTVIDLDQQPFGMDRQSTQTLTLYEPNDAAIKNFSALAYTDAFQQMFTRIRKEYAFSGIPGKEPNWDQLYSALAPRVAAAQQNNDGKAFYEAIRDFSAAFHDGHVGLSGGQYGAADFQQRVTSGYGFAMRELDDGSTIVTYVTKGSPADQAGIAVGAQVTQFNGQPIKDAISAVTPSGNYSTDFGLRYQQQRYLLRAPVGTGATVTFANTSEAQRTASLQAAKETQSFNVTSLYRNYDPNALPVTFEILPSGIGYVKITSFDDDLNLILRLFERALKTFQQNQVSGVIIDLRLNPGGSPLGLAGYLYGKEIPLSQLAYFSEKTGKFELEGVPGKVYPNETQYPFNKLVLLVDQACASACEIEAYGFSQIPGIHVIGEYPTAGVEAEVSRGQYELPDGLSLQVPTGRELLPDGSIFLEGKGVQPNERVPINAQNVLSQDDVVLQAGEKAILGQ